VMSYYVDATNLPEGYSLNSIRSAQLLPRFLWRVVPEPHFLILRLLPSSNALRPCRPTEPIATNSRSILPPGKIVHDGNITPLARAPLASRGGRSNKHYAVNTIFSANLASSDQTLTVPGSCPRITTVIQRRLLAPTFPTIGDRFSQRRKLEVVFGRLGIPQLASSPHPPNTWTDSHQTRPWIRFPMAHHPLPLRHYAPLKIVRQPRAAAASPGRKINFFLDLQNGDLPASAS